MQAQLQCSGIAASQFVQTSSDEQVYNALVQMWTEIQGGQPDAEVLQNLQLLLSKLSEYPKFDSHFKRQIITLMISLVANLATCLPALEILYSFVTGDAEIFDSDLVIQLFQSITAPKFEVPTFGQKTRYAVYKIYQGFTLNKKNFIDKLYHPIVFVSGVLSGIYQERDPRNLITSIDLTRFLMLNFFPEGANIDAMQESQFLEELFDAVSCYFPINFTPPKNDPLGVKPEQLKSLIEECFIATPKLAGHFIPFLLEKITASAVSTKLESLQALTMINTKYQTPDTLLNQQLSSVSNLFFNYVADSSVQLAAAKLIGLILDKMIPEIQPGITFNLGKSSEPRKFIDRCLGDIERSPESMSAGLSSILLQNICVVSSKMQHVVAEYVFLTIVDDLEKNQIPILRRVAYMTVLTSLLTKVFETNQAQPFIAAIEKLEAIKKLKSIIYANLEIPQNGADSEMTELWQATSQLQPILQEKTLYLFCALMDLMKLDFSSSVIELVSQVLIQQQEDRQSVRFKMAFSVLQRESTRDSQLVSSILRPYASSTEILRVLYEGGLLRDVSDVEEGIRKLADSDNLGDEALWMLKPLLFCVQSKELDQICVKILQDKGVSASYLMVKSLLMKIQQIDQVKISAYSILPRLDAARCLTFILKHKKVDFGSISEIAELATTRPKLAYYLLLRPTSNKDLAKTLTKTIWQRDILSKLFLCKALMMSGQQEGFELLSVMVKDANEQFAQLFNIITDQPNKVVTKENGFCLNRLYTQRLYAKLYPQLKQIEHTDIGVQLLIQSCNLITVTQQKCQELIPIANQAFKLDATNQVKLTCVQMFKRVLNNADVSNASKQEYLNLFVPKILSEILQHHESCDQVLLVESLVTMQKVSQVFPSPPLKNLSPKVLEVCNGLKEHRKRVVRKFARGVINEWSMLK